jgi:SAM-dependent methyltransferase
VEARIEFYKSNIDRWLPDRNVSILVVAGEKVDREVFESLAFKNVIISNLAAQADSEIAPYAWSQQDLEGLTYKDGEFDYVVVHAGLHHCRSPHRGLLEMYRVARRGIIAFDPADNFTVRMMQRFRIAQVYELVAVESTSGASGGVNNSQIPNFIYRWTEREVRKTINSYAPAGMHRFRFAYGADRPTEEFTRKSVVKRTLVKLLRHAFKLYTLCVPRQGNLFGFMVEKPTLPRDLHAWLTFEGGAVKFIQAGKAECRPAHAQAPTGAR